MKENNSLIYQYLSIEDINLIKDLIKNYPKHYVIMLNSKNGQKKYPGLWNRINQEFLSLNDIDKSTRITTKIYMIIHGIKDLPRCKVCGNIVKNVTTVNQGFHTTCGNSRCSQLTPERLEKTEQTNMIRLGVKHPMQNKNVLNKAYETFEREHGCKRPAQCKECFEKMLRTSKETYGFEFYSQTQEWKNRIEIKWQNKSQEEIDAITRKNKQTRKELYDDENYNNRPKAKQTCIKNFGYDSYSKTTEFKEMWKDEKFVKMVQDKINKTMKENETAGPSSKMEDYYLEVFQFLFGKDDVISQYRDPRYVSTKGIMWKCDIYVKSLDWFIEIQGSQFHHGHPFDPNNPEDIKELELLKEKAETHPKDEHGKNQYHSIIETWTIRDVEKRETAKKNNLNYLEIWKSPNRNSII